MFEGVSADTCAGKFALMSIGNKRTVKRAHPVNEDPHWGEDSKKLKFIIPPVLPTYLLLTIVEIPLPHYDG
jgi:hypothetical protein